MWSQIVDFALMNREVRFQAQQAAEKAIKSVFIARAQPLPYS